MFSLLIWTHTLNIFNNMNSVLSTYQKRVMKHLNNTALKTLNTNKKAGYFCRM